MKHANLLQQIGQSLERLRRSERKVAHYVLAQPQDVIHMRIVDLAQEAAVSEPTVVRFCRAIGCDGFQDFKLGLAQQLAAQPGYQPHDAALPEGPADYRHHIIDVATHTLERLRLDLDLQQLERAVSALHEAERTGFYGSGSTVAVAQDAQYQFLRLGRLCSCPLDEASQVLAAASYHPGDLVVILSRTGNEAGLLDVLGEAKRQGAQTLALSPSGTPIASSADMFLAVDVSEEPAGFSPQVSRITLLTLVDVLAVGVSRHAKHENRSAMSSAHEKMPG